MIGKLFRDGKEKEQIKKDKALMDEVNRSEFLQHLLNQGEFMSRSEIMGQMGALTRKIIDIEDDNYDFFESAGMTIMRKIRLPPIFRYACS